MFWEVLKVLGTGAGVLGIVLLLIVLVIAVMLAVDQANGRNPFL